MRTTSPFYVVPAKHLYSFQFYTYTYNEADVSVMSAKEYDTIQLKWNTASTNKCKSIGCCQKFTGNFVKFLLIEKFFCHKTSELNFWQNLYNISHYTWETCNKNAKMLKITSENYMNMPDKQTVYTVSLCLKCPHSHWEWELMTQLEWEWESPCIGLGMPLFPWE